MAFLDNSGDIILDAVLTDTGRMRLAKGDGSFKIAKFALGDDEIDYSMYQNTMHDDGAHSSGSAYYDLNIMQSPVLEAFTNNMSSMKTKLVSLNRTDLLYLPVIKLNEEFGNNSQTSKHDDGLFVVAVDEDTEGEVDGIEGLDMTVTGMVYGVTKDGDGAYIRLEQGLDTSTIPPSQTISPDLAETQYIVEIDNRLGTIYYGSTVASVSYVDDDQIASYYLAEGTDSAFVGSMRTDDETEKRAIGGPRGTLLQFKVGSSTYLQQSDYYFTQFGGTGTMLGADGNTLNIYYIDTMVRVSGVTTGYKIDIPVRFVKLQ